MYDKEKILLPEFPRTMHLPIDPNATSDDKIASEKDLIELLNLDEVIIQEKIDGANSGFRLENDLPLIRNRTHILNKNYSAKKTPAQKQFKSAFTWFHENKDKFIELKKLLGWTPSVYGEWLYAKHTIFYDQLPDVFVAYDIYSVEDNEFICPKLSREVLQKAGFSVIPLISSGKITLDDLLNYRNGKSQFSSDQKREGIYIKTTDNIHMTSRYKMVAPWFKSHEDWNKTDLIRNRIARKK